VKEFMARFASGDARLRLHCRLRRTESRHLRMESCNQDGTRSPLSLVFPRSQVVGNALARAVTLRTTPEKPDSRPSVTWWTMLRDLVDDTP
jgi:hypothetical protein